MFYLYACSKQGVQIILHVRGYSSNENFGFVDGEGIFEVQGEQSEDFILTMNIVKKVGVVQALGNQLVFNYTDFSFKELVGYKEDSGYSSLDGGLWKVQRTEYLKADGNYYIRDVKHNSSMHFMYLSARAPINNIPNPAQFFSPSIVASKPSSEYNEANKNNGLKCNIL